MTLGFHSPNNEIVKVLEDYDQFTIGVHFGFTILVEDCPLKKFLMLNFKFKNQKEARK
jgi:hypothetical protein